MSKTTNQSKEQPHPKTMKTLGDINASQIILDNLGEGVIIAGLDGKFEYFNYRAESILGIGAIDIPPKDWNRVYGCYKSDQITLYPYEQLPLVRALRGETVVEEVLFIKNDSQVKGVWISATANPIRNSDGSIQGGVMIIRDITETRLAREKVARLAMAVEQTADGVIITDRQGVIEYVNPGFEALTGYTREEAIGATPRLLKSGHQDDAFYRRLWEQISSGNHYRATVLNKKKDGALFWVEQTITPLIDEEKHITHYVSVIKDITELRQKQEQDFQLDIARQVQQQFYPENISLAGYDIAGGVYPADETGGDYYDFIQTPDNHVWFVIADVAGHGIGSALIMAETRAFVHAYVETGSDPGTVLRSINRKFIHDPKGSFVTMLLARLDPAKRSLVFANAGHLPAYLLDPAGKVSTILKNTAIPLGTLPDWQYTTSEPVQLPAGHLLLFLTDGVLEAENMEGEQFGMDRVLQVVKENRNTSAQQIIEHIHHAINAFAGDRRQQDDITLVICKIQETI